MTELPLSEQHLPIDPQVHWNDQYNTWYIKGLMLSKDFFSEIYGHVDTEHITQAQTVRARVIIILQHGAIIARDRVILQGEEISCLPTGLSPDAAHRIVLKELDETSVLRTKAAEAFDEKDQEGVGERVVKSGLVAVYIPPRLDIYTIKGGPRGNVKEHQIQIATIKGQIKRTFLQIMEKFIVREMGASSSVTHIAPNAILQTTLCDLAEMGYPS